MRKKKQRPSREKGADRNAIRVYIFHRNDPLFLPLALTWPPKRWEGDVKCSPAGGYYNARYVVHTAKRQASPWSWWLNRKRIPERKTRRDAGKEGRKEATGKAKAHARRRRRDTWRGIIYRHPGELSARANQPSLSLLSSPASFLITRSISSSWIARSS